MTILFGTQFGGWVFGKVDQEWVFIKHVPSSTKPHKTVIRDVQKNSYLWNLKRTNFIQIQMIRNDLFPSLKEYMSTSLERHSEVLMFISTVKIGLRTYNIQTQVTLLFLRQKQGWYFIGLANIATRYPHVWEKYTKFYSSNTSIRTKCLNKNTNEPLGHVLCWNYTFLYKFFFLNF